MNHIFAIDKCCVPSRWVWAIITIVLLATIASKGLGSPRVLMIASEAHKDKSSEAIASIKAQLSDLGVDFLVAWTPTLASDLRTQAALSESLAQTHQAVIVFWADLSVGNQIFLFVSEPGGGRILVRTMPFETADQGDRFEVMAVIVRSVVGAIAQGGHIGVSAPMVSENTQSATQTSSQEASPSTTQPSPPTVQSEKTLPKQRLELGLAYGLTFYSKTPLLVHGARLGLGVRLSDRVRLLLGYRFQVPFDMENSLVKMTLRHHPFELGVSGRLSFGKLYLDLGAMLVNDPMTWSGKSKDPTRIAVLNDQFRWLVAASPFIQLSWSPFDIFKFFFSVGADIFFNENISYVKLKSGEKTTVVDPFHVRPHFQLGMIFYIF